MENMQIHLKPEDVKEISCKCGSVLFQEAIRIGKISALISPTGKEEIIPMKTLICLSCKEEINMES